MYIFSLFVSLWLVQRVTADSFYGGYSQSTKYCGIVNVGNDKSNPGIYCQCLFSGEYLDCNAEFESFLVNDQGQLKFGANGAAQHSCHGWSLFDTILAANCSGPTITMVNLDEMCGTANGKLMCGEQHSQGSATSSLATPTASSGVESTPASTFTTSPAPKSTSPVNLDDQTTSVVQTPISSPSIDDSQTPQSTTISTEPSATASADTTNTCGSVQKRTLQQMRIMGR
ncbi:uncharacterized protein N7473_011208 [Penicillium subrubescens]|uniref:uncharacterized protein n=1 Tax=Penicillium subrubescens TaxID=1316194 RepID=UPI00254597C7|nr:uncharacterized protein N7473_011208 [Penicillium subrubescens]KAJ5882774.1 hypothetical protein N7473_011208 [Penicillium subrubescens]